MIDVIILWHNICQADRVGRKEGIPALHNEQLLRHYDLHHHDLGYVQTLHNDDADTILPNPPTERLSMHKACHVSE